MRKAGFQNFCASLALLVAGAACNPLAGGLSETMVPKGHRPGAGPDHIEIISGDQQNGAVGQFVSVVPTIKVADAGGLGIDGVLVNFEIAAGEGSISTERAITDEDGIASFSWKLGTSLGTNTVRVTPVGVLSGEPGIIYLTANARAGSVHRGNSGIFSESVTLTADGVSSTVVSVVLKDEYHNPIHGKPVLLESNRGANDLIDVISETTDDNGVASFKIQSTVAGTATLSAADRADDVALQRHLSVNFQPGSASDAQSTLASAPSAATADGLSSSTITITLKDAQGNPISGITPVITATGTGNSLIQPSVATDANGQTTAMISSTQAAVKVIRLTSPAGLDALNTQVTFSPGSASAATSSLSAIPASNVVADGGAASVLTVTLKDAQGNPISGVFPVLTASGSGNSLIQPSVATNANGQTTALIQSTKAETKTISVSSPAGLGSLTAGVTFVAGPAASTTSSLATGPASGVTADGASSSTVTITLKDAQGNPVIGVVPALTATGTGNTLIQATQVTDVNGQTTATIRSTKAEAKTLGLFSPSGLGSVTASVEFVAGSAAAATSSLVASPSSNITANGTSFSTLAISLKDAQGNPVIGVMPVLTASGTGNTIAQATSATNANGETTATITSTKAEVKTIGIASPAGLGAVTTTLAFVAGAASSATSTIAFSPESATADGVSIATITISLKDAQGNPVSGITPVLASSGTGNTLIQTSDATDANGQTTASIKSTVAESKTIQIASPASLSAVTGSVAFLSGAASSVSSTLSASPTSGITADGNAESTITITLQDAQGNPISGVLPAISLTGTGNSIVQPAVPTNGNGQTTATIKSTVAETKTINVSAPAGLASVTASVGFVAGAASVANSALSVSPSGNVTADESNSAVITVTLRDAQGNPISGVIPTLSATGTGNTLVQPSVPTDVNGETSATIKSNKAEIKTISIATPAGLGGVTSTVGFVAGSASAAITSLAASPSSSVTADGATSSVITITLKDAQGNPISGLTPVLATSGTGNALTQASVPTDANGQTSASITSTKAETKTISISSPSGLGAVSTAIDFVAGLPVTATSTLSATPAENLTADGVNASLITITLKDAHGNPVSGVTPVVTASGTGNSLVQPASATDGNGQTTASLKSTKAESKTIVISSPAGLGTITKTVTFVNGSPYAANSTLSASSNNIVANGVATTTLTLTLHDANDNPVSGVVPVFASGGTGNTINQPALATDANGQTSVTMSSTVAQTKLLSISSPAGLGTVTTNVTFVPGPVSAATSTLSTSPSGGVTADGSTASTVTVTLKDAQGNPISGVVPVLSGSGSGNVLTQPSVATDANGTTTASIRSTIAEPKTIGINSPSGLADVSASVVFVASAPVAANSSISVSPSNGIVADGTATTTLTLTLRDANNNPVSGVNPVFTATGSGNTIVQPAPATDVNGQTSVTMKSTVAEMKSVGVSSPAGLGSVAASVTFVPGAVSASTSTVSVSPASNVTADGASGSTITITLRDAQGNPISGVVPQVTASGTGNTLVQPSVATNASGQATATLKSTVAESKTIGISSPAGLGGITASIGFISGAASASTSTVSASPASNLTADGSASSTITVTLKDAQGNPISGAMPVFFVTGSGNTVTQPSVATDASGQTTATLKSTGAGSKAISISSPAGLSSVNAGVTFVAGPVSASTSTLNASPVSNITADGAASSTITITLKDAQSNPISGVTPVIASSGSGNTITQPSGATNASGQTTATLKSAVAENKTVTISSPAGLGAITASVSFVAGSASASSSSLSASPANNITADGVSSSVITIIMRDDQNNPISGILPVITSTGSGNAITQSTVATDLNGHTTASIKSTKAETKTISVSNPAGLGALTLNVAFIPGAVSPSTSTMSASPSSNVTADGATSSTVTITLKDAYGNPISGVTPSVASTGTGNTITQPSAATNLSGQTTATIKSTKSEAKTITVSSPGGLGSVSTTVMFVPSSPAALNSSLSASPASNVTADGSATTSITITLRDENNNPVSGVIPVFASTGTDNTINQPALATDSNGETSVTMSSTKAEAKTISVTSPTGLGALTAGVAFVAGAPSALTSLLSASPSSNISADGVAASIITVTLNDAYGNAISGVTPVLAVTGSGNTLTQAAVATNASGQTTASLKSTSAESKTLSISSPAGLSTVTAGVSFMAVVTSVDATKSTVKATPASIAADGATTSTVYVVVKDSSGNPLNGKAITLSSNRGGVDSITGPNPATTDSNGQTTFTVKSSTTGSALLSATVTEGSITINQKPTVLFLAASPWTDYQASLADLGSSQGLNSPSTSWWKDAASSSASNDGNLFGMSYTTSSGWGGDGTIPISSGANGPYRLVLDGTNGYVDFGTGMNSTPSFSFEAWIRPSSVSTVGTTILGNLDSSGKGLELKQADSGKIVLHAGGTYSSTVLSDNPVAYLRLGESSGTTAVNLGSLGAAANGTYANSVTLGDAGAVNDGNTAAAFNGSTHWINNAAGLSSISDTFTIEFWAKPTATRGNTSENTSGAYGTSGQRYAIFPKSSGLATDAGAGVSVGTNGISVWEHDTGYMPSLLVYNSTLSGWNHIVVVYSAKQPKLYLNGTLVRTGLTSSRIVHPSLYIGEASTGFGWYAGSIDEVAIYSSALPLSRIQAHYSAGQAGLGKIGCLSTSSLADNMWYFIAGVFDSAVPTMKLFVNGNQECAFSDVQMAYTGSANSWRAGADANAANKWAGQIAEFRTFESALTAANVVSNMNANGSRFEAAPSAPTSLSATPMTASPKITLSWSAGSTNSAGYKIERSTDGNNFTQVGTSSGTTYTDTGLAMKTLYHYRVRAYNVAGNSSFSDTVSATSANCVYSASHYFAKPNTGWWTGYWASSQVYSGASTPSGAYQLGAYVTRSYGYYGDYTDYYQVCAMPSFDVAPSVPTGLSASAPANATKVNLSWTAGSSNALYYKVERSTDGTNFSQVATPAGTSYVDTSVATNTTYYYRVRAYNGAGNSSYSAVQSATTANCPFTQSFPTHYFVRTNGSAWYGAWNNAQIYNSTANPSGQYVLGAYVKTDYGLYGETYEYYHICKVW